MAQSKAVVTPTTLALGMELPNYFANKQLIYLLIHLLYHLHHIARI